MTTLREKTKHPKFEEINNLSQYEKSLIYLKYVNSIIYLNNDLYIEKITECTNFNGWSNYKIYKELNIFTSKSNFNLRIMSYDDFFKESNAYYTDAYHEYRGIYYEYKR